MSTTATELDHLVDLSATVACEWPHEPCARPAVTTMVQLHTRPALPCIRVKMCAEHKAATIGSERAWLKAQAAHPGSPVICSLHHRRVETLARWEPL